MPTNTDTQIQNTMPPEQQRIKIAEACGWKGPHHPDNVKGMDGWWSQTRGVLWINPQGQRVMVSDVPNYLNDLNAMHEAEFYIPSGGGGFEQYVDWLEKLTHDQENPITATAAQRAEAFLRTLNLWV